jgi:C-terminal processing protease CtpA/Prc
MFRSILRVAVGAVVLTCACSPGDTPIRAPQADSAAAAEEIFETVWTTFDERYALFGARSVDWRALYDVYRPMVGPETTDEELFEVLTAMLSHLNDNHVVLQAESLGRDFSAGYLGSFIEEIGLEGAMELLSTRPLPRRYFQSGPHAEGEGRFEYGWVEDGIGYFHFGGFADPVASAQAVDSILEEFDGARGVIVDVRRNSGGDDRVGKAIADRFADRRRLYMITRDRNGPEHDDFAEPKYWHVEPAERTFTGPVVLLTNRLSVSAAENFALAMRVLPHVTVVGDITSGCFADMEWFELTNGWRFSVAKNLFVDYAGRCWEGIGVPPDIMVRGHELEGDNDRAFELALSLLKNGGPALQDEGGSAAAARVSLVEELGDDLETGGFVQARAAFDAARTDLPEESWYVNSGEINALGYRMLGAGRYTDAVGVFELSVELFPNDANAYDSLGEAFMMSGDSGAALTNYQISLDMNPNNDNAADMVAKLRGE